MSTYLSALLDPASFSICSLLSNITHRKALALRLTYYLSLLHIYIYFFFFFIMHPSSFNTNLVFGMCVSVCSLLHFQMLDNFFSYLKSLDKPTALKVSKRRPRVIAQVFNVHLGLACRTSYIHIAATSTQCLPSVYIP